MVQADKVRCCRVQAEKVSMILTAVVRGSLLISVVTICLVSGRASAQYMEDKQAAQLKAQLAAMRKNINKSIWVTGTGWNGGLIEFCPSATERFKECVALKVGTTLIIKDLLVAGPTP